ncbi:helix-turn-helix domain-containing protein [Ohtaekwangia sp.]|uniref:helix-turn-helix domain-containing protein n=1 Tax=Ohtaekwangia sp. TaxID=2066019 RepID=UPI002F94B958
MTRKTSNHEVVIRIEAAKNRLLNTSKSISEIVDALGFEYPQYFNKLFKQKTGKTPWNFEISIN